jgi:hypothetical protein
MRDQPTHDIHIHCPEMVVEAYIDDTCERFVRRALKQLGLRLSLAPSFDLYVDEKRVYDGGGDGGYITQKIKQSKNVRLVVRDVNRISCTDTKEEKILERIIVANIR